MNTLDYKQYQDKQLIEHEDMCKNCGACCGVLENDPCEHLNNKDNGEYFCDIYEDRFGLRKTINNNEIKCVPIRNILHKTWSGQSQCAYVKAIKSNA